MKKIKKNEFPSNQDLTISRVQNKMVTTRVKNVVSLLNEDPLKLMF